MRLAALAETNRFGLNPDQTKRRISKLGHPERSNAVFPSNARSIHLHEFIVFLSRDHHQDCTQEDSSLGMKANTLGPLRVSNAQTTAFSVAPRAAAKPPTLCFGTTTRATGSHGPFLPKRWLQQHPRHYWIGIFFRMYLFFQSVMPVLAESKSPVDIPAGSYSYLTKGISFSPKTGRVNIKTSGERREHMIPLAVNPSHQEETDKSYNIESKNNVEQKLFRDRQLRRECPGGNPVIPEGAPFNMLVYECLVNDICPGNVTSFDCWNTSIVTNMDEAFVGQVSFNAPIGIWDVSAVTSMVSMFNDASSFNQPLGSWDVSAVTDMDFMFKAASSYNQPLYSWDVSRVSFMRFMFDDASSFNQPLASWNVSEVTSMDFMFRGAASFNQPLASWDVSAVTAMNSMFEGASSFNQPLDSWVVSAVTSMGFMFSGASSLNQPLDSWDVSAVTSMNGMFYKASSFNKPLDSWNVSAVSKIKSMFYDAASFNQPLASWDISAVANMGFMFSGASSFNQPLNAWNVSAVKYMYSMFYDAASFNQPLNSWDVSAVLSMDSIFTGASSFNQCLSSWELGECEETVPDANPLSAPPSSIPWTGFPTGFPSGATSGATSVPSCPDCLGDDPVVSIDTEPEPTMESSAARSSSAVAWVWAWVASAFWPSGCRSTSTRRQRPTF